MWVTSKVRTNWIKEMKILGNTGKEQVLPSQCDQIILNSGSNALHPEKKLANFPSLYNCLPKYVPL